MRCLLLASSLWIACSASYPAQARGGPRLPLHVLDAVSHGVKLSVLLPRHTFAVGELTRLTLRVQNLSHHSMSVVPYFPHQNCQIVSPQVESVTPNGTTLYPPAVRFVNVVWNQFCPTGGGPGPAANNDIYAPLAPGTSAQTNVDVIVRTRFLRAEAGMVEGDPRNRTGQAFTVRGNVSRVRLVARPRPRIQSCSATGSCLRILPPFRTRVSGPIFYSYSVKCKDTHGNIAVGQAPWPTPLQGNAIRGFCNAPPVEVHLVAGWMNHPVVRLDYVKP